MPRNFSNRHLGARVNQQPALKARAVKIQNHSAHVNVDFEFPPARCGRYDRHPAMVAAGTI
jgi:hypothetical protein